MSEEVLVKYREKIEKRVTCSVVDLPNIQHGDRVMMCGIYEKARELRTRNCGQMSIGELRDLTGSVETVFFPDLYKQFNDLTNKLPVFLECKVNVPDEVNCKASIIVYRVIAFEKIIECELI